MMRVLQIFGEIFHDHKAQLQLTVNGQLDTLEQKLRQAQAQLLLVTVPLLNIQILTEL